MAKKGVISLSEAATRVGVSRQTIYRKAAQGKLSIVKRSDGSKGVQIAELERLYTLISNGATVADTVTRPVTHGSQLQVEIARLRAELDGTRVQLANAEAQNVKHEANYDRLWDYVDSMKRIEQQPEPREPGIVTKLFKKLF